MKVPSGNSTVTLLPWVHFLQVMLGSGILCPLEVAPLVEAPLVEAPLVEAPLVTVMTRLGIGFC